MNLIVLHGNGLVGISNRLLAIKKEFDKDSVQEISVKKVEMGKVLAEISTPQLFSDKRLVILEDIEDKINVEQLPEDDQLTLVLRFNKSIPKNSSLLKQAVNKKAQVIELTEKEESNIFPFLDGLVEKKSNSLKELEVLYEQFGSQYILTMIYFQLRKLATSPKNLPPFVLKKIAAQKQNFNQAKLVKVYRKVLETDFKIKQGLLEERIGLTILAKSFID